MREAFNFQFHLNTRHPSSQTLCVLHKHKVKASAAHIPVRISRTRTYTSTYAHHRPTSHLTASDDRVGPVNIPRLWGRARGHPPGASAVQHLPRDRRRAKRSKRHKRSRRIPPPLFHRPPIVMVVVLLLLLLARARQERRRLGPTPTTPR